MSEGALAVTIIAGVVVLLGGIFLCLGIVRSRMIQSWTSTTGMVVNRDGTVHGMAAQYPTFRWVDQHGIEHQRTSLVRASLGPKPGTLVEVRYDPARPERAIVDTFVQSGRIFTWIGAGILAFGIFVGCFIAAIYLAMR